MLDDLLELVLEIIIDGAEAMNKSYPSFLEDIKNIKIFASIK